MKKLHFAACLLIGVAAGLLTGCSTTDLPIYGPSYYDPEAVKVAVVTISDTNYPALFNSPKR